jgi:hypothetical protein
MIELVLDARRRDLGGGFAVDRLLPSKRRTLGPFVLLDHGGPDHHAPEPSESSPTPTSACPR